MKYGLWDELQDDPDFINALLFGESYYRGISVDQTCIVTGRDRGGNMQIKPSCLGRPDTDDIKNVLHGKFASDAIMVTDSHNAYPGFARDEKIQHEQIEAGKHAKGAFTLGRINGMHSKMSKHYSKDGQRVPATKYLGISLMLFYWLEKNDKLTTAEQVEELFDIVAGNNGLAQITRDDIQNKELDINTKGFPKAV